MNARSGQFQTRARGFSMIEVNLAILILTIGLIMVAAIFPVGADYTRQNAEESVSQTIARNAMAILQTRMDANDFSTVTTTSLQAIPNFLTKVPVNSRAYNFGSSTPTPVANPDTAQYFWTALARLSPISSSAGAALVRRYDVYIFVFKKGSVESTYANTYAANPAYVEVSGLRGVTELWLPALYQGPISVGGSMNTSNPTEAIPPRGGVGVGVSSGTVFRQVWTGGATVSPRPALINGEQVIFAPGADGNADVMRAASPLVFVYQTSLTF